MKVSELNYNDITQEIVDKVLFEGIEDAGLSGDCIIVLGSRLANNVYTWAIITKDNMETIGYVNNHAINDIHKRGEISY